MYKGNFNNILMQMFHLRNKSHLTNNQATQLAFKSSFISDTFMGSFMAGDAMSKEELSKQGRSQAIVERDSAIADANILKNSLEELHGHREFTDDQIKEVQNVAQKIILAKLTGRNVKKIGLKAEHLDIISANKGLSNLSLRFIRKNFS